MRVAEGPSLSVVGALSALYLIWGSTYLAVAVLIVTVPPFLSAGARFLLAGAVLYAIARLGGARAPDRRHWGHALPLGALFFLGGNGGVVWGVTRVPSGLTALLVAMMPMWIAVFEATLARQAPSPRRAVGLLMGTVGVVTLVGGPGEGHVDPLGALSVIGAAVTWALGTVASRSARLPESNLLASGMEMMVGGALLGLVGVVGGELPALSLAQVDGSTVGAFLWLTVGGSLVGFTVFQWLLKATTPAIASTYAYVNPVVAVLLGWWWADEPLSAGIAVAGALIVSAVALITSAPRPLPEPEPSAG